MPFDYHVLKKGYAVSLYGEDLQLPSIREKKKKEEKIGKIHSKAFSQPFFKNICDAILPRTQFCCDLFEFY